MVGWVGLIQVEYGEGVEVSVSIIIASSSFALVFLVAECNMMITSMSGAAVFCICNMPGPIMASVPLCILQMTGAWSFP